MNLAAATRKQTQPSRAVYGAGNFGRMLVREMRANTAWEHDPVAFIDDDAAKAHRGLWASRSRLDRQHRGDQAEVWCRRSDPHSRAINGSVENAHPRDLRTHERPVRRLHMEIQ